MLTFFQTRQGTSAPLRYPTTFGKFSVKPASLNRVNTKQPKRGGHTRVKRDIVPQFATQCSDEAESSGRFGFYRA
jgi:hypothetical protein